MNDAVIHTEHLRKVYRMGEIEVPGAAGCLLRDPARRGDLDHGAFRLGQIDPDEHPRLPGPPDQRASTSWTARRSPNLSDDQLAVIRNRKVGFVFQSFNLLPRITPWPTSSCPCATPGSADGRSERAPRGPGSGRAGRPHAPPPQRAFRRAAAARGHRPRAGQRPADPAGRRADRQPGFEVGQGDHGAAPYRSTASAAPP